MLTQQDRRNDTRVPCKLTCGYKLTTLMDSSTVEFSEGVGLSLDCSESGMLLLLPEEVTKRQVFQIHVRSKRKEKKSTNIVEVCWTRLISVSLGVNLYLAGTRFLFELPGAG